MSYRNQTVTGFKYIGREVTFRYGLFDKRFCILRCFIKRKYSNQSESLEVSCKFINSVFGNGLEKK